MMTGPVVSPEVSDVCVRCGPRRLQGVLAVPGSARGVVAFAHGSGSGRLSPRNQLVARALQKSGLATLLLDLLEADEDDDREKVFDIELLSERLHAASEWLAEDLRTARLPLGYFGASTGAAAALVAAAAAPSRVQAVVCRGGRPDLAGPFLQAVKAPTLLIVGGADDAVLALNEAAMARMCCPRRMEVIPAATHLFPEDGALERVAELASDWFRSHLTPPAAEGR